MPLINEEDILERPSLFVKGISRTHGDVLKWTPALTSTGTQPTMGDSVVGGEYTVIGPLVTGYFNITLGSTFAVGTGNYLVAPPVTIKPNPDGLYYVVGSGYYYDASVPAIYAVSLQYDVATGSMSFLYHGGVSAGAAAPVVPAQNDQYSAWFNYFIV